MPNTSGRTRAHAVFHGTGALDALARTIDDAKAGDPLAPVTVIPPSMHAGRSLRHTLGSRIGLVNTRFLPFGRVAELLGAPVLSAQGRRPLTSVLRSGAVRAVLDAEPGVFAGVSGEASTEDALDAVFRELRRVPEGALDDVAGIGPRTRDVVRLFREFRDVTSGTYDDHDLSVAAATAVAEEVSTLRDVGAVVLHLPRRLAPSAVALVEALRAADVLWAVVGFTGDQTADQPAVELLDRIGGGLGPPDAPAPGPPPVDRIVIAPDPEEEVRVLVRDLEAHASAGIPLHRVALVARDLTPYGPIAADALADAGIPVHGPQLRTLAQTATGRTLLSALRLPDHDFSRREVMAWLHGAPILGDDHRPVPADRWDRHSRDAGVTTGALRWSERLEGHARRLDIRGERAGEADELTAAARLRQMAGETRSLRAFVEHLGARLATPTDRSWAAFASWARSLVVSALGGEGAHGDWPEHEVEAWREIDDVLDAAASLDSIGAAVDTTRFRRVIERELATPAAPENRTGAGIFVGRVADVVGASFDVVHMLGVTEGTLPSRGTVGVLVTERERERLRGVLLRTSDRRRDERHDFLAAAAAGPTTLSFPRSDPRAGRAQHPSRWVLEMAEELHGRPLDTETLTTLRGEPWLLQIPSTEWVLTHTATPGTPRERDLADLLYHRRSGGDLGAHPLVASDPRLGAGFAALRARASSDFTPWDGRIGPIPDLFDDRMHAPTTLEAFLECPFRYLMAHVLRVGTLEEPEDIEQLRPDDRGTLVHEILERLVDELGTSVAPDDPWGPAAHARLDEIADACFAEWDARGLTGHPLLWQVEQEQLRRTLHRTLDEDSRQRAQYGTVPVAVEHRFQDESCVEVTLGDGTSVRLKGAIDRVDRAPDGSRLRVVDYKTGRPTNNRASGNPYEGDPFAGGTKLQLPVYALAARAAFGDVPVIAQYWYVSERWNFKVEGNEVRDEHFEELQTVLGVVAATARAGAFPARPGEQTYRPGAGTTFEHCAWCHYDRICGVDRAEAWDRKHGDPALGGYTTLVGDPQRPRESA